MRRITLALTHFNRLELITEAFAQVLNDERISEIVISDDASTDGSFAKLIHRFAKKPKVRLFTNAKTQDCYQNKRTAVMRSSSDWIILFDSDNVIGSDYLDCLYEIPEWDRNTIYCPTFAEPHFDYRAFNKRIITRQNVAAHMDQQHFQCALNTANYFFYRDCYLNVWDGNVNPHTSDTIYQALNWLRSGRSLTFVPNLKYYHRVHPNSHYKQNCHKTGDFAHTVEKALRQTT